jgi:hypothetical protein
MESTNKHSTHHIKTKSENKPQPTSHILDLAITEETPVMHTILNTQLPHWLVPYAEKPIFSHYSLCSGSSTEYIIVGKKG